MSAKTPKYKSRRYPDTKPQHNTPQALAAAEGGGFLQLLTLKPVQPRGCGTPTRVAGANGGQMPCGALLTRFGKTEPYFCGHCQPN